MIRFHRQITELSGLLTLMAAWTALFSLLLLLSGYNTLLPGFFLGFAGSCLYVWLLYRRVTGLLSRSPAVKAVLVRLDWLNCLRSNWKNRLLVLGLIAVIWLISRTMDGISFLMAFWGFFSFQVSICLYTILLLFAGSFRRGHPD